MNNLVVTSPTGSPSTGGLIVAVSSSFVINGQQVVISSQNITDITKGINFQLAQPVALGSIDDFIDWLNKTFDVPFTSQQLTDMINKLPDSPSVVGDIKNALLGIFKAVITITVLSINTQTGAYSFGVTMRMETPINILNVIALESIGVVLSDSKAVTSP